MKCEMLPDIGIENAAGQLELEVHKSVWASAASDIITTSTPLSAIGNVEYEIIFTACAKTIAVFNIS